MAVKTYKNLDNVRCTLSQYLRLKNGETINGHTYDKSKYNYLVEPEDLIVPNATTSTPGLMSADDKSTVDVLKNMLTEDSGSTVVDTIHEVLSAFDQFPEQTLVVDELASKANKVKVGDTEYSASNGVISLPAYPIVPTNYVTTDTTQTISGQKTFSASRMYINGETHFTSGGNPTDYAYGQAVGIFGKNMMVNTLFVPTFKYRTAAMYNESKSATTWNLPNLDSGETYTLATTNDIPSISDWAKASTKPSYTLDEVSDGNTRKLPTKTSSLTNDSGFITSADVQPTTNTARTNLGNPTIYEMGIIDGQFTNKTMAYPPANITIYRSSDGTTLTEATEYSDAIKKTLVVGDDNTDVTVTVNTYLVIEIKSKEYVYLNCLYIYGSTSGTFIQYKIEKSDDGNTWTEVVPYTANQNSWPGHTVVKHNTIPFQAGKYVRLWAKCLKQSETSTYTTAHIYKLQWWGGYPMGRRTYYRVDSNQNHIFPAGITATSFTENGTALSSKYLGISAKAANSDKLDGQDSSYYLNYNNLTNKPTIPTKVSELTNDSGFTTNTGTVTSVSAGTGLSISGTATVNPTVNIASDYKLPTTDEWKDSSIYSVVSGITTSAGSASSPYLSVKWTVDDVSGITTPYDGMKIVIRIPLAGVGTAGVLLSIDGGTTYHPVAYNVNTPLTTHYPVNTNKVFVYNATQMMNGYPSASSTATSFTGVWQGESNYDSNTTITYGTLAYYFRPYAAQDIYRYKFVMLDDDNRLVPLTTTNVSTGSSITTNQTPTALSFRPDKIYWYNTTGTVTAGHVIGGNTLMDIGYNANNSNNGGMARCNFNEEVPAYRMIYLCGTYNKTTGLFSLRGGGTASSTTYYTFVPTNTANLTLSSYFTSGYDYILLGGTYSSATYIHLRGDHPMYHFDGDNLVPYDTWLANQSTLFYQHNILFHSVENGTPTTCSFQLINNASTQLTTYALLKAAMEDNKKYAASGVCFEVANIDDFSDYPYITAVYKNNSTLYCKVYTLTDDGSDSAVDIETTLAWTITDDVVTI